MPTLSMFYGIVIRMFNEEGAQHKQPHFHANYASYDAIFNLDGEIMAGSLPSKQRKLVVAWAALHRDELQANWDMLSCGENPYKIDALK